MKTKIAIFLLGMAVMFGVDVTVLSRNAKLSERVLMLQADSATYHQMLIVTNVKLNKTP